MLDFISGAFPNILRDVIFLTIIAVVFFATYRSHGRNEATGDVTLEYGAGAKIVAASFTLLGLYLAIDLAMYDPPTGSLILPYLFFVAFFVGLPLFLTIECFGTKYRLSATGIQMHRLWSKDVFIAWNDVVSVKLSPIRDYVIRSGTASISVQRQINGIASLLRAIKQYVPYEKWQKVADRIGRFEIDYSAVYELASRPEANLAPFFTRIDFYEGLSLPQKALIQALSL